jgi:biopolymer transport protein ExbB
MSIPIPLAVSSLQALGHDLTGTLFIHLAAAAPATTGRDETDVRLWDYIQDGGILSYVLIGLSFLAVASMVFNALEIRRVKQAPPAVLTQLERLFGEGSYAAAQQVCLSQPSGSLLTSVVGAALTRALAAPSGMGDFRGAVEASAPPEVDRLHRHNDWLGIIAAVAPMLGLLGTVIGMIGAFRTIGTLSGTQRSNELATFMSMALVNTAEGLVVAIPCTIAFAIFRRRIDQLVDEVGGHIERLALIAQARTAAERS